MVIPRRLVAVQAVQGLDFGASVVLVAVVVFAADDHTVVFLAGFEALEVGRAARDERWQK